MGLGSHGCACVISGTERSRCDVMFPCVVLRKNEAINVITLKTVVLINVHLFLFSDRTQLLEDHVFICHLLHVSAVVAIIIRLRNTSAYLSVYVVVKST